jgi:hypothetical protein
MAQPLEANVRRILAEVGKSLDVGASLHLLALEDGVARIELRVDPEACEECIVPLELLQTIVESRLAKAGHAFTRVDLINRDPPLR